MSDPADPWTRFRRVLLIGGRTETQQWRVAHHIPTRKVIYVWRAGHVVARLPGVRGTAIAVVRLPGYDEQATPGLLEQRLSELRRQGAVDLSPT